MHIEGYMNVHRWLNTILVISLIGPPLLSAQSTAQEDSALWKADSADLVIQQRDKTAPKYSKDAQRRIWVRDSTHANKAVTPPSPPTPVAKTIEIHGNGGSVDVGKTMQLYADVKDSTGTIMQGAVVTWSAGPLAVADISGTGMLTGKSAGTTAVTAKSGSAQGIRSFAVIGTTPPDTTTKPPVDTTTPPVAGGFDGPAELPRATVDVTMPIGYNVVNVGAVKTAMQDAINAAGCRTELRGAPNFEYGIVVLPQKPCNEKYHTIIRTGNGLPLLARGVRQTVTSCAQRQCAKIVSRDAANSPAVSADRNVHGYYFEDIAILGAGTSDLNAVVKLGINQTTLAEVPGDFVFSHVLNSGTPTLRLRRNYYINSSNTAIVDGSCLEGHDNNSDSQCFLGLNGPGPYLIKNNYMEASHEVIMFGGGDPTIPNLTPSDVWIIGNHITRPANWKGVWTVKNLLECKNVKRLAAEGNVFENNWGDGQVGYFFLCKSVNQDGTAPWSTSQDIVFRYNLARNTGAGINLCASCQGVIIPMARASAHDNIVTGLNVGQFTGEAREWQFLGGLSKISVVHNTTVNAAGVATAISFDGQPPMVTSMNFVCNAYDNGQYGIHGGSGGSDWRLWVDANTSTWTDNLAYPAGGYVAAGFDARGFYTGAMKCADGKPLGADAAKIYSMTANVVVTDTRPQLRRPPTAAQTGYRPTSPEDRQKNTRGSGPSVH